MDFNTPASRWARSSLLLTTLLFLKRSEEEIDGAVPYAHQHIYTRKREFFSFLSHVPTLSELPYKHT